MCNVHLVQCFVIDSLENPEVELVWGFLSMFRISLRGLPVSHYSVAH